MARSYFVLGTPNQSNASGLTTYYWGLGYTITKGSASLAQEATLHQVPFRKAITVSRLDLSIATNTTSSGTNALTVRKNGAATSLAVTVGYGYTGWVTPDTTNSVSYNGSTDWGSLSMQIGGPSGTDRLKIGTINIAVDTADNEMYMVYQNRGPELSTGPRYGSLTQGAAWGATYNGQDVKTYFDHACTLRNAQVKWNLAGPTDSRWMRLYKNGVATSIAVELPAGSTGLFTDLYATTGHEVSIAAGDYVYWELDTDGDTTFCGGSCVSIDAYNTEGYQTFAAHWGTNPNYPYASGPWYNPLGAVQGAIVTSATGQTNRFWQFPGAVFDHLRFHVKTNDLSGDVQAFQVRVQKNGVDQWGIDVPASDPDNTDYHDTTNSLTLDGDDEIGYKVKPNGTAGELVMTHLSIRGRLWQPSALSAAPTATAHATVALGGGSAPPPPTPQASIPMRAHSKLEILPYGLSQQTSVVALDGLESGRLEFRLDNRDRGELVVDEDAAWLALVDTDLLVRVTDHNARVSEWKVEEVRETEAGDGRAHLTLRPLYGDLGRRVVREVNAAAAPQLTVTVAELTCEELWDQVLSAWAPWWLRKGLFTPTEKLSTTQTGWSLQQWLDWAAAETNAEVELARLYDGTYEVNILPERGAAGKSILFMPRKQVIALERTRRLADIATHILPVGMTVPGAVAPAGLGQNAFVVTAVDLSADYVDIADPTGADAPVYYDNEFNPTTTELIARTPYLMRRAGTLTQILDTEVLGAGQGRLYVTDASGFAVGHHVSIVGDANGGHLIGLYDPARVSAGGVIEGTLPLDALRGERNYAPNPDASSFDDAAQDYIGLSAQGTGTWDHITLYNLRPGLVIPSTASLHNPLPGGTFHVGLAGGGVVDAYGYVTLDVAVGGLYVSAIDQPVVVKVKPTTEAAPEDWATLGGSSAWAWKTSRAERILTASAFGAQTGVYDLLVDGLVAGDVIPWGWEANGKRICAAAVADGSGRAQLSLAETITVADNDTVTIQRPCVMGEDAGAEDSVVALGTRLYNQTHIAGWVETDAVGVLPQGEPVHAQAWLTSEYGTWDGTIQYSPYMQLIPSTDPTVTVVDGARASYPTPFDFVLRCSSPAPSALQTYKVRVYSHAKDFTAANAKYATAEFYVRGVMLHAGADPAAPYVYDSHGNAIWHATHRSLSLYGSALQNFVLTVRDLSALAHEGYVQWDNVITLGATIRIKSARFGVDVQRRIVSYFLDLVEPENSGVVLDNYEPELTRLLVSLRIAAGA